jgi:hypothetical protein
MFGSKLADGLVDAPVVVGLVGTPGDAAGLMGTPGDGASASPALVSVLVEDVSGDALPLAVPGGDTPVVGAPFGGCTGAPLVAGPLVAGGRTGAPLVAGPFVAGGRTGAPLVAGPFVVGGRTAAPLVAPLAGGGPCVGACACASRPASASSPASASPPVLSLARIAGDATRSRPAITAAAPGARRSG